MTREEIEEIGAVGPYCFKTDREKRWYEIGCIEGLVAADEEPNLERLWHDATEEPKIGSNIVAINKYGHWWDIKSYDDNYDLCGLKGWKCWVRTYDIKMWAYIDELLPKECKK